MHSSGKAPNRNQVQEEGEKTQHDFPEVCLVPLFLFFCVCFADISIQSTLHDGQRLECLPTQTMRGFGEEKSVIVAGSGGTRRQPENAHMKDADTLQWTHKQVNKHTKQTKAS